MFVNRIDVFNLYLPVPGQAPGTKWKLKEGRERKGKWEKIGWGEERRGGAGKGQRVEKYSARYATRY